MPQKYKKDSGIYQIKNLINGKIYIGQSVRLYKRRRHHFEDFKHNRHGNTHLRNSVNKYGVENFKFSVLLRCHPEHLTFFEQRAVDILKPQYNKLLKCVTSAFGYKHTQEQNERHSKAMTGFRHSEESKKKISDNRKEYYKYNFSPAKGRVCTEETREKLKNAWKNKEIQRNPLSNKEVKLLSKQNKQMMSMPILKAIIVNKKILK